MTLQEATRKFHDAALLWFGGYGAGADVVRAACELLVAGADSRSLAILAGVSLRYPDEEVHNILPAALDELRLPYFPRDTLESQIAALKVLADRAVTGLLPPRELVAWTHRVFGHDRLPLAEYLSALDDEYDMLEYSAIGSGPDGVAMVDARVLAEARRIAHDTDLTI